MNHFNDFDLQRWQRSGPGEDRERIIGHVGECAPCASRYGAAIKSRDCTPADAGDVRDFVAAGYRVRSRRQWLAPLAAAAVLVIAVAVPLMMRRGEPAHELRFRGSGVQALTPNGTVDLENCEFVWASGISATQYRIEVGRANTIIYTREAMASRVPMPPDLRRVLRAGNEYWWRVTALDARGQPLVTSERVAFFVRSR